MPAPSIAQLALQAVEDIRALLGPDLSTELPLSPGARSGLILSLGNLESAALRRIEWSERETRRRADSAPVKIPRPTQGVD